MEVIKFDAEKVKAGDVVGKFSDEELKIFATASSKRRAIKEVITNMIKQLAQAEFEAGKIWWKKTSFSDDRILHKRDLMLSGDPDTGNIVITKMCDVSHETALFPLI